MLFSNSPEKRKKELIRWAHSYKIDALYDVNTIDQITRLELNSKQIDKLPKQIDCLVNLEILDLGNNNLSNLPWEFGNLKNLKWLNLGYNKLQEISGVVCQLTNLEFLNFEANLLKKVNLSISNLKLLKELNLFANRIVDLPDEIGSLSHLVRFNLALNQLCDLPASFSKLYNITTLELWLNKFELVPDVISKLPNLTDLYSVVDPEKLNKTLIWSVIGDNVCLVEKLIFYGADVNFEHEEIENHFFTTPLFEAKSIDMINLLLSKGADPNLKREIVKHVASKNGEERRPTGKFETFLTKKHPKEIQKFIKSYTTGETTTNNGHAKGHH